ncbi:MAG: DNA primase [Alphaproteobacteria bacterium]
MSLPPSFLEDIRLRLPVSEIVGKHVRLVKAGREYKACCPFHHEKSPSFYVNDEKQFYHCFGCGAHGDVISFTMRQNGLTFPETIETLAGLAGLTVPKSDPVSREIYDQQKIAGQLLERATRFFQQQLSTPAGQVGRDYFYRRGLSDDAIERFRLGFAPQDAQLLINTLKAEGYSTPAMLEVGLIKKSDNSDGYYSFFRNRVIFPVGDKRGNIVAFGARLLAGDGPKYINSPDHPFFHKGKLLYGLSRARGAIQQNQPLIVMEGYMDVIAAVEAGYAGAVAPLGTALTEDQMLALWKLLPRIEDRMPAHDYTPILCFDGDAAGQRAATRAIDRALPLLNPAQSLRIAFMPPGEDPDSLLQSSGKLALQNVLDQAKPLIDVIWEHALLGRRLRTPEEKAALRLVLRQKIQAIGDEALRNLYAGDLKERLSRLFGQGREPNQTFGNRQNQPRWQGQAGKSRPQPPVLITRRTPNQPGQKLGRIILATLINHPDLLGEFLEDMLQFPFQTDAHRIMATHMAKIYAENNDEVLDYEQYFRHLSEAINHVPDTNQLNACLSELLSEHTYMHAGFARPEQETESARVALREIWNRQHAKQADPDIAAAHLNFLADGSEENQRRLLATVRSKQAMQSDDATEWNAEQQDGTGTNGTR